MSLSHGRPCKVFFVSYTSRFHKLLYFRGSDDPVDALFLLDQEDWPTDIVNTTSSNKTPQKIKDNENKENEPKSTPPKVITE